MCATFGAPRCQSISAHCVDAVVSAIEVSLQVAENLGLERRQLHGLWKQRLERAAYDTALARRRYQSVDLGNRLVARTLERDWDTALAAEQKLGDDHHHALQREPEQLTDADKAAVRRLAACRTEFYRAASTVG